MGVPSFQQLMLPALQTIGQRYDEISISGLEDEVSKALKISVEERQLRLFRASTDGSTSYFIPAGGDARGTHAGSVLPFGSHDVHGRVGSLVKWSQRQLAIGRPATVKMCGRRPYLVAL